MRRFYASRSARQLVVIHEPSYMVTVLKKCQFSKRVNDHVYIYIHLA